MTLGGWSWQTFITFALNGGVTGQNLLPTKRMNRVDRLLSLILYLQSKRVVTAEEIARHFELSIRTIYRDLNALGEAGVPIVAEAGVGYCLMKGYHLPPVTFTSEEAGALATGGVLVGQMTDASLSTPMRSALQKIRAVLPREQQEKIERIEGATLLLARRGNAGQVSPANLLLVQDALARRRVLQLAYRAGSTGAATAREVEPLGLTHYMEHWHLIAWCRLRRDFRDFRLDRIEGISLSTEIFQVRAGFQLSDYLEQMRDARDGVKVRVRFSEASAARARREWSLGVVQEETVAAGSVLTLSAGELEWFVGWLLSFGTEATVLEPAELREKLVAAAEMAARHHKK